MTSNTLDSIENLESVLEDYEKLVKFDGMLGSPEYTNPAIATAIARIRKENAGLLRVVAINDKGAFGYDLPYYDANSMKHSLMNNPGYFNVICFKLS